jgi:gluconokinase
VAYDAAGRERGRAEAGYPLNEPAAGQEVQDPDEVVAAALTAIRGAARAAGGHVAGVAVSSAMHSLAALDRRGRPLTPLLTWADARAVEQAEQLRAERPELHDRTGTPLHPMSPLPKLLWFREREPETFAAAARWVGIKELVLERLTGEWLIDASCASGTGLLSLERADWDEEALAVAGVRPEQLARLVEAGEYRPLSARAAEATGLAAGTPVVAGAGDGPLANLGVGAVRPGVAACSIGTSGALRMVVEAPAVDPSHRAFCYVLTPGRWVVGGAINNGGVVLRWAGEALAPDLGEHPEKELLSLAAGVPAGSEGLVMLPYLMSERAPHWSAVPRGAYVGLTRAHGRGHLVRAALEGVCQQLGLVLASLREAGNEVREVRATGGFARSELWRQMLADVLGMPIGFPAGDQGSAFGAALVGLEALGMIPSIELAADLLEVRERREPDPSAAARYQELRPVFAGLYDALMPTFLALRGLHPL